MRKHVQAYASLQTCASMHKPAPACPRMHKHVRTCTSMYTYVQAHNIHACASMHTHHTAQQQLAAGFSGVYVCVCVCHMQNECMYAASRKSPSTQPYDKKHTSYQPCITLMQKLNPTCNRCNHCNNDRCIHNATTATTTAASTTTPAVIRTQIPHIPSLQHRHIAARTHMRASH